MYDLPPFSVSSSNLSTNNRETTIPCESRESQSLKHINKSNKKQSQEHLKRGKSKTIHFLLRGTAAVHLAAGETKEAARRTTGGRGTLAGLWRVEAVVVRRTIDGPGSAGLSDEEQWCTPIQMPSHEQA
jgi:hypothetical protein